MFTGNAQFEIELKKRIIEEVERIKENLALGNSAKDYAEYQNHVGRIAALRLVTDEYCDEVQVQMNKR